MSGFLVLIAVIVLTVLYLYGFALMRAAGRVPSKMLNTVDGEE